MASLTVAAAGLQVAAISRDRSSCVPRTGSAAAVSVSPLSASFSGLKQDGLLLSAASDTNTSLMAQVWCVPRSSHRPSLLMSAASPLPVVAAAAYVPPKRILMMGGSRFIGVYLARLLVKAGHEVTLFTRGKAPVTKQIPGESDAEYAAYASKVKHLKGDRKDFAALKAALAGSGFQVVYDINGREAAEVEPIIDALPYLEQYIYCSSAGVYLKSDQLPHREEDAVDPKSRHKGKLDTEALLRARGVRFTSVRPVYIYGPLNYNPVEEWFFQRLAAGRPIPIPNSGKQVTQLGHVKDLARAFVAMLGNEAAIGEVFNISGPKYVTFDGIAKACAEAMGAPEPTLVHFNPKDFDFGKKKAFPLRDQHFFASNDKAERLLGWKPEFGLVDGLKDSYSLDFGRGTFRKEADFSTDDIILSKTGAAASTVAAAKTSPSSSSSPALTPANLRLLSYSQLRAIARQRGVTGQTKQQLLAVLSGGAAGAAAAGGGFTEASLASKGLAELRALGKERGIRGDTKTELIRLLLAAPPPKQPAAAAAAAAAATNGAAAAAAAPAFSQQQLEGKSLGELRGIAKQRGLRGDTKAELIKLLISS